MIMHRALRRWKILDAFLAVSALGILTLSSWLYARFGFTPLAGISDDSIESHMDFNVFLHSARALWEGGNIFTENGGPSISTNPPLWTVLIAPFAPLEPITAYRLFVLITVLTGVGYLVWMAGELKLHPAWAIIGAVTLLLSNPWFGTLALGQVYPLLAFGLVAAWVADRRGKPALSGVALGLVLAVKPQLAPVLLWPLARRRWRQFVAALAAGAAATLVGMLVTGPGALVGWVRFVASRQPDGYWDNNTLPAAAARLFRDNEFVEPVARLLWAETAAYVVAIGLIVLTALWVRRDPEMGLWALVAASLLAPPVSWHNYLVLLGPGILLLLARGWTAPALLLLALQTIPPAWSEPWRHGSTVAAALMLNLHLYILLAHWLVFVLAARKRVPTASVGAYPPKTTSSTRSFSPS
jgi:alpha-1,2-mannosyltransferase